MLMLLIFSHMKLLTSNVSVVSIGPSESCSHHLPAIVLYITEDKAQGC